MANKAVPKWKRYREIKKRVNAHVSCIKNTLSINSERSFHKIDVDASQVVQEESEANIHSPNITQNSPS